MISREEKNKKARLKYMEKPVNYKNIKRNAKNWDRSIEFTENQLIDWYHKQDKICKYCGISIKDIENSNFFIYKKYRRLTIDRIDNNKGYSLDNICLACMICNRTKSNIFSYEQMTEIGKLIRTYLK